MILVEVSFAWIAWETASQGLSGCREVEEIENASLTLRQLYRMNDAAQRGCFFDERTDTKGTQDAFGRHAFFRNRRIVGNGLTIKSLHEVIRRQRDLEQVV